MDTFETLVKTGLDKKRSSVLAALIDVGPLSMSQISAKTHINRPALYILLPQMLQAQLIVIVKKNKRVIYKAESPRRILEQYTSDYEHLQKQLTEMAHTYEHQASEKPIIKYLEGARSITYVFDDVAQTLPKNGLFFRYSSRIGDDQAYQNTRYARIRETKGIERMAIVSEEKAKKKPRKLGSSFKAIPRSFDLFADNISLVIYADKTAYIDYESKTSLIVESAKIARFQEKLFRLLFKKLS
jgi:sugar-specific transcriptional regulator TrmB